MSADAASLPCPVCSHASVFDSAQTLRDRLIQVSTNKIPCPVCQEEICGLDKLTIHLFTHVQVRSKEETPKDILRTETNGNVKCENDIATQKKKSRSGAKNKSTSCVAASVKLVKLYPKLPVISLNPVPIIDITQRSTVEGIQSNETIYVKTEPAIIQTNTTCNICGLQFVDINILKMHRCLIHNIDDNTPQTFTRYNCHLCPKNFKMRGSLMVHLRVAHYGFLSGNDDRQVSQTATNGKNAEDSQDHANFDKNDNKQWQCDVCRKHFTTKYFLKKHKRLHTGETPYACTQCNKTFTFQQSYHKHLLYHNDEKPHTCTYCGRAFKELSTLHNHQRIHTGEKPFACETCGKCFRQRVSYLVHRRIHTGVMPYKCTACEKSFRYKVSQRTHKCQAQPPGTVVRQTGDLVEKLKMKHIGKAQAVSTNNINTLNFVEVSEANAELVRSGAKLSLEDMESESFSIITDTFKNADLEFNSDISSYTQGLNDSQSHQQGDNLFHTNLEELIETDTRQFEDKNVPSPSEILRNLSLSRDDETSLSHERKVDLFQDFNLYL